MVKRYEALARFFEDNARCPEDNEAAIALRKLGRVYEVAYEMVWAKTYEHSKAAYVEMIDLIKGKEGT